MPTPTVYRSLQVKLQPVRGGLAVGLACSAASVFAAFVLMARYDPMGVPTSYGMFVLVGVFLGASMMWLLGVAGYQQEPWVWRVPLLGRLHRAWVKRPTPWGQAMALNCTLALPIGIVGLMYVLGSTAR